MNIHDSAMNKFQSIVVRCGELYDRITQSLIDIIFRERTGDVIGRLMVKSLLAMLIEVDGGSLGLYGSVFEQPLLETSEVFFMREATEFLNSNTVPDYMAMVGHRISSFVSCSFVCFAVEINLGIIIDWRIDCQSRCLFILRF